MRGLKPPGGHERHDTSGVKRRRQPFELAMDRREVRSTSGNEMKRSRPRQERDAGEVRRFLARLVVLSPGGVMPDPLELVRSHRELVDGIVKAVGGLDAAREQAGLRQVERHMSEERVATWLRELAATGWRVTPEAVSMLERRITWWTYRGRRGGFAAFRDRAGLSRPLWPESPSKMPRADALDALRRWSETGTADIDHRRRLEPDVREAIEYHFGSLTAGMIALRVTDQPAVTWTANRVLRALRKRARTGRRLDATALIGEGEVELVVAATRLFGSVRLAREYAEGRGMSGAKPPGSAHSEKPPTKRATGSGRLARRWAGFVDSCRKAAEAAVDVRLPAGFFELPVAAVLDGHEELVRREGKLLLELAQRKADDLYDRDVGPTHLALVRVVAAIEAVGRAVPEQLRLRCRRWLEDAAREPNGLPRRWTRELVVRELRAHAAAGRVTPKQLPSALVAASNNHFGSLRKARADAQLEGPVPRARR